MGLSVFYSSNYPNNPVWYSEKPFPGQQAFVHKDTQTHSLKTEASLTSNCSGILPVPPEADGEVQAYAVTDVLLDLLVPPEADGEVQAYAVTDVLLDLLVPPEADGEVKAYAVTDVLLDLLVPPEADGEVQADVVTNVLLKFPSPT